MNTSTTNNITTIVHINTPWRHPNGNLISQGLEVFDCEWLGKERVFSSEVEVITDDGNISKLDELFDQIFHRKTGFAKILDEARLIVPRFIFVIEKSLNNQGIVLNRKRVIEELDGYLMIEDEYTTHAGSTSSIPIELHGSIWFDCGESIPSYDTLLENYASYMAQL